MPTELSESVREFLLDQIDRLNNLDYLSLGSPSSPFIVAEIGRTELGELETRLPPRFPTTPLKPAMRSKLVQNGFVSDDPGSPLSPWLQKASSPDHALALSQTILSDVFDVAVGDTVNIVHGSHRAEHEARKRLEELRARIEPVLTSMLGHPPERDADGDYQYPTEGVQLIIAPRVIPGAVGVVRVIAITNGGVTIAPDLGLFLARLNFGLMFGRFALDAENQAIWFDETLLGDDVTDAQLRFTVKVVSETATEWAPKLQQMFGGITHAAIEEAQRQPTPKPGAGGYL